MAENPFKVSWVSKKPKICFGGWIHFSVAKKCNAVSFNLTLNVHNLILQLFFVFCAIWQKIEEIGNQRKLYFFCNLILDQENGDKLSWCVKLMEHKSLTLNVPFQKFALWHELINFFQREKCASKISYVSCNN